MKISTCTVLFGLFILLVACQPTVSENNQVDTEAARAFKKKDTLLFDSLNSATRTARKAAVSDRESSLKTLWSIEQEVARLHDNTLQIDVLDQLALAFLKLGDSSAFEKVNDQLLNYQNDSLAAKATAWHYMNKNRALKGQGQLAAAYKSMREGYNKIQEVALASRDTIYRLRMLASIASIEVNARRYESSESTLFQCLTLLDQNKNPDNKVNALYGQVYNQLGGAQLGMKKYDKALEYFEKANDYGKRLQDDEDRSFREISYLMSKSSVFILQNDYQKAFGYYADLMSRLEELNSPRNRVNVLVGYGSSGYLSGALKFKASEAILDRAMQYAQSNIPTHVPWVNYNWALVLQERGRLNPAVKKMELAQQMAQQYENTDREIEALKFLSIYAKKNNAQYSQAYATLVEKTWKEERELQRRFAEVEYQTEEAKADAAEKTLENERIERSKQIWLGISLALLLAGFGGFIIISQRSRNKELIWEKQQQVANEEIYKLMLGQRAKLEEGKKIAEKSISEEIHDGILGEMLGIRLILSGLNESSDEAAVQKRQELIEQLQGLEEELRSISHQLNASAYNKVNEFALALEELLDTNCKPVGLQYSYSYTPEFNWDQLPGEVKIQLYRMVQSGLKNTIKHAKATEVDVKMVADGKKISLEIKDNGIGFDPNEERKGIGLKNLRSRIQKISGKLEIRSAPGKGTLLHIRIPHKYLFAETNSSTTQTA